MARFIDAETLRRAFEPLRNALRPVSHVEAGSGRMRLVGTAVVLDGAGAEVVVTAEHVVEEPGKYLIGVSRTGSRTFPRDYQVIRAAAPGRAAPDLAFAVQANVPVDEAPDEVRLRPHVLRLPHDPSGMPCVIAGMPASRAKPRQGQARLFAELLTRTGVAVAPRALESLGLDPLTFFGISCSPAVDNPSIDLIRPQGMSGGAVFTTTGEVTEDEGLDLRLAGILVEYHRGPRPIFIAARVEALLQALDASFGTDFIAISKRR